MCVRVLGEKRFLCLRSTIGVLGYCKPGVALACLLALLVCFTQNITFCHIRFFCIDHDDELIKVGL